MAKPGPKPLPVLVRFLRHVKKTSTCWLWTGALATGYGSFRNTETRLVEYAHRVSYKLFKGEIPDDLEVCHSCNNRRCVRPAHLYLGTHQRNIIDAHADGLVNHPRGEQHERAKITAADVKRIRGPLKRGELKTVAAELGISFNYARNVRKHKTWRHIQ